jgi:polyisoprenyl-phosphate glycosyltransferase
LETGSTVVIGEKIVYSVAIPTYRGEGSLEELLERLYKVMTSLGKPFEIVIVDDASPDQSWHKISQLKLIYPELRAFQLSFNVGQFRALMCAFDNVRGELVVTMDDDLQNPPEEIPKLVKAMEEDPGLDGVIGVPITKAHHSVRNLGSRLIDLTNSLIINKPMKLKTSSFRLLRRHVVEAIRSHHSRNPVMGPLVILTSRRLANVSVKHEQRDRGKSNYSWRQLVRVALDHVFYFSTLPLKLVSFIGMLSALTSFLLGLFYIVFHFLRGTGEEVKGWMTLVTLIIFYNGLILFSVGLTGEYLIRIVREVSHSPRYIIRASL